MSPISYFSRCNACGHRWHQVARYAEVCPACKSNAVEAADTQPAPPLPKDSDPTMPQVRLEDVKR
jgi:hypothetical protein